MLLLEDDADLGRALAEHLVAAGHAVSWCRSLDEARDPAIEDAEFALLDRMLPDGDALDLLREWRRAGRSTPAIAITARDQIADRIAGLRAGADDYLVKPFDLNEMLARVDAVARRAESPVPQRRRDDISGWQPGVMGDVRLTAMECAVLECLRAGRGRIYSRDEIEAHLAMRGFGDAASNSLEVIVSRLRRKLGAGLISTLRGLGYRLNG